METTCTLAEIGELKNGYAFKSSSYDADGTYRIITIANVTGDRYVNLSNTNSITDKPTDLQEHQALANGDILISLTGNVGRVSICNDNNCLLNQRVGLFVPNSGINKEFVYQCLSNCDFERTMIAASQGAAQMNISKGDVERYRIPISHNIEHLDKISRVLHTQDKKIDIETTLYNQFLSLKQFLLHQLFI